MAAAVACAACRLSGGVCGSAPRVGADPARFRLLAPMCSRGTRRRPAARPRQRPRWRGGASGSSRRCSFARCASASSSARLGCVFLPSGAISPFANSSSRSAWGFSAVVWGCLLPSAWASWALPLAAGPALLPVLFESCPTLRAFGHGQRKLTPEKRSLNAFRCNSPCL